MSKMSLTFPWKKVEEALAEVRAATEFRTLYGEVTGPGLLLVGDEGVYLMPNTKVEKPNIVIYAHECDPTTLEFDEWWENKRALFGGGDGIEFLSLDSLERFAGGSTGYRTFGVLFRGGEMDYIMIR